MLRRGSRLRRRRSSSRGAARLHPRQRRGGAGRHFQGNGVEVVLAPASLGRHRSPTGTARGARDKDTGRRSSPAATGKRWPPSPHAHQGRPGRGASVSRGLAASWGRGSSSTPAGGREADGPRESCLAMGAAPRGSAAGVSGREAVGRSPITEGSGERKERRRETHTHTRTLEDGGPERP